MQPLIRYNGQWFKITPKPYEPERVTFEIAWMKLNGDGYLQWFKKERNISKIVYNE